MAIAFAGPAVFVILACVAALWPSTGWFRSAVYVVYGPASFAIATGLYLELPRRSTVVTSLLVLAGVGSVVLEGVVAR
jgi:hypothetical protein